MQQLMTETEEADLLLVSPEEEGMRIDRLLAERFPNYSRTYFQYLIEQGAVLVNGERVKKRESPVEGDEIEIFFIALPEISLEPEPIPLDIVYEDEHLVVVNKAVGMVVHPAPGHWSGTFVNALLSHCETALPGGDPVRPGIVHRLDKETSGLLIAAKTVAAHQKLIEAFAERRVEKSYLALCSGRPPNGEVRAPIGRHPTKRKEMAVVPDGKEAITSFQLLAFRDGVSLVLAKPKTGRTHQIRVHLKHLGAPVLGDSLYGNGKVKGRQLLHAYRLSLTHPITGLPLSLSAPIPDDMKEWISFLSAPCV